MKTQSPQFSTVELIKAASIAQIDPASIPANANPWSWNDSRAISWQSAFRSLNPAMAQEAEVSFGPPLSLALQAALDELIPMTTDLERELSIKRPHQHQQRQQAAALQGLLMARTAPPARPQAAAWPTSSTLAQGAATS
jgi:hypothetical protein